MKKKKLKRLADNIANLENECQQGNNITSNIQSMENIMASLKLEDLIELMLLLEEKNFDK